MITRDRINKIIGNKETIICSIILATLPVLVCILRTAVSGKLIGDVWLGASTWNDEAFYYKQVEGMVKYGIPRGFFGYNESHAQYLTFGAWTPLILLPWAIWGKLFGWNMLSPIICNIISFSFALLVFAIVVKINRKQLILIFAPLFLFTPLSRYLLSCMPEAIIISMLIICISLFASVYREYRVFKVVFIYIFLAYSIVIRPYLAVFMALPLLIEIKRKKRRVLIPVFVTFISFVLYVLLTNKLTCAYFGEIYVGWIDKVGTHGARVVIREIFASFRDSIVNLYYNIRLTFTDCNSTGAYFLAYIITTIGWISAVVFYFIRKNYEKLALGVLMLAGRIMVLLAILVMYNLADGSKHLITFIVIDIFLFALCDEICVPLCVVQGVLFTVLFIFRANNLEAYAVPYKSDFHAELSEMESKLDKSCKISSNRWDNTFAFAYDDYDMDGEWIVSKWQYMYAIPKGYGINFCNSEYLDMYGDELESMYIVTVTNGEYTQHLYDRKKELIYQNSEVSVFKLREIK